MSNLSFSDLSVSQRRERIAALLGIGLQRVLEQRARIAANSDNSSLEVSSDLRLSVSQPDVPETGQQFAIMQLMANQTNSAKRK